MLSNLSPDYPDCGAASHRTEIVQTQLSVKRAVAVEPTIGELPTKEGTPECVRVTFFLTPWGTMYHLRFVESSSNYPFEVAVRRAIEKYEFRGSLLGIFDMKTLLFDGVDNRRPESWDASCVKYGCGDRSTSKPL
jgi:hypothetical protein